MKLIAIFAAGCVVLTVVFLVLVESPGSSEGEGPPAPASVGGESDLSGNPAKSQPPTGAIETKAYAELPTGESVDRESPGARDPIELTPKDDRLIQRASQLSSSKAADVRRLLRSPAAIEEFRKTAGEIVHRLDAAESAQLAASLSVGMDMVSRGLCQEVTEKSWRELSQPTHSDEHVARISMGHPDGKKLYLVRIQPGDSVRFDDAKKNYEGLRASARNEMAAALRRLRN